MTNFKKEMQLEMDSNDEGEFILSIQSRTVFICHKSVKMYRWLSDEPHHVLLIEWRICEVSRDNYETINFGLSEIVRSSNIVSLLIL